MAIAGWAIASITDARYLMNKAGMNEAYNTAFLGDEKVSSFLCVCEDCVGGKHVAKVCPV